MARLTQKLLIEQVKTLKEIKPRQEWASLLKSQILSETKVETKIVAQKVSIWNSIKNWKLEMRK